MVHHYMTLLIEYLNSFKMDTSTSVILGLLFSYITFATTKITKLIEYLKELFIDLFTRSMRISYLNPLYERVEHWINMNTQYCIYPLGGIKTFNINEYNPDSQSYDGSLSMGYGSLILKIPGLPLVMVKRVSEESKPGSNNYTGREPSSIKIYSLSTSSKFIYQIMDSIKQHWDSTTVNDFRSNGSYFRRVKRTTRDLSSVIVDDSIKNLLLITIEDFLREESKSKYQAWGIPYRKTIVIHSSPGMGKTSLINALKTYFNLDLYVLNLSCIKSDIDLEDLISNLRPRSMVLIEDIDCAGIPVNDRSPSNKVEIDSTEDVPNSNSGGITLSGLLNVLDGVHAIQDCIVFMTTNHIEKIDPALLRSGRCDLQVELSPLDRDLQVRMVNRFYPNFLVPEYVNPINPCDLQAVCLESVHKSSMEPLFNLYFK